MSRRALLLKFLFDIRSSYWFIPSCLVVVAFALSLLTLAIDANQWWPASSLPTDLTDTQIDGARTILGVIAQAVIGVTGVMFSVTMVAVSFASGNFGPRLIGNFMRDRGNQWSLGILIATFCYTLLILRSIQTGVSDGPSEFVPQVSIAMSVGLILLCVFVIIYFVHHIPETINVGNISALLGERWCAALGNTAHDRDEDAEAREIEDGSGITLGKDGYVQRVDTDRLQKIAEENRLQIALLAPPGQFLHRHQPALRVSGDTDDATLDALRNAMAVGKEKTEDQNLLFLAEQQIEMIARALSPGVNDPYTAMNCLNWLAAGLAHGASKGSHFGIRSSKSVHVAAIGFERLIAETFVAAMPYVSGDAMVKRHLHDLIETLMETDNPHLRSALRPLLANLDAQERRG